MQAWTAVLPPHSNQFQDQDPIRHFSCQRPLGSPGHVTCCRDGFNSDVPPEETTLLPPEDGPLPSQYRRAIIGRRDRTLDPMLRAGSIIKIDTHKRAIASRKEVSIGFDLTKLFSPYARRLPVRLVVSSGKRNGMD